MNSTATPGKLRPRFKVCHVGNPRVLELLPGLTNSATPPPGTAGRGKRPPRPGQARLQTEDESFRGLSCELTLDPQLG